MAVIDSTWNWRQLSPATPPSARNQFDMVWAGTRVILFGGVHDLPSVGIDDETWEMVGDEWNQLSPGTVPAGRGNHRLAWDGTKVLMLGGLTFGNVYYDETWKFETGDWTDLSEATGYFPISHLLAWDTVGMRFLALVQDNGPFPPEPKTLEFTSGPWSDTSPSPDIANNHVVQGIGAWCGDQLLTGAGLPTPFFTNRFNDMDSFDGTQWTSTIVGDGSQSYTPSSQYPRRTNSCGVWTGDQFFFFGGADGPAASAPTFTMQDQYLYDKTSFEVTPLSTANIPPNLQQHRMVFDGTRVILFGGRQGASSGPFSNETWVLEPPDTPDVPQDASIRATIGL